VSDDRTLKIAEITSLIKEILEGSFPNVTLEGEISNARPSSAGHLYFTLKDETSAISAVMFKGRARLLPFAPTDGLLVRATGNISVYEARGTYQIIVEKMSLAGEGDILRMLEERKRKLAAEGLFDEGKKRPIPAIPSRVAVITSPTGAAIRDILQVIGRRNPGIDVTILPAPVQGSEAAPALVRQIETANRYNLADVIVIGRGGGSLEDLLPFSDEALVRAIASSRIPTVSAVGHEIDWSLCDLAADLRAPTPSAAAELVAPRADDLATRANGAKETLVTEMENRLERARLLLDAFSPESLEMRFRRIEQPFLLRFDDVKEALIRDTLDRVRETKHRVSILGEIISGANPRALLKRGYAVVRDRETGRVIRSASDTAVGRSIEIVPENGLILASVEECQDEKNRGKA